jgi:hypothetical protein
MIRVFALCLLIFTLVACGSSGSTTPTPQPNNQLAGTYNGEIVIGNTKPFVSVLTTLTIENTGTISGTTTGTDTSDAPGEKGNISGTVVSGNSGAVTFDLSFSSATLGNYSAKGNGVYSSFTKEIAGSITAKDANNVFIGDFVITLAKE